MTVPPYSIIEDPSKDQWDQFIHVIRVIKWTSHDNMTLGLLPSLPTTKCVFATKDDGGSFLGGVVWNEFDEIAWVGMYVCLPEVRGCGIGSKLWRIAMERIRISGKAMGLRGVLDMATKYAARETPFEISRLRHHVISSTDLRELCSTFNGDAKIRMKSTLSAEQLEGLHEFDHRMTGRDRRDLLRAFLASSSFECAILFDGNDRISGWAGITSVGLEEERMFKLGPVYTSSLAEFARLTEALIPFCESIADNPKIVVHILSGTIGERELEPLFNSPQNTERVTLFSKRIDWQLKREMCVSPLNSCAHFDG
ncbi:hypothetical protein PMAYCL1PPCAC_00246 [Pristionchus mayeri]|uniref:N-acetyltransferase domain-containing protein n=1 Tax=Pristionchus mayeri TaxID=1317129 RepID=A0AAN5C687_9BILA|nr:hypothetical protein PMAYCL1PPCAC_00246 [Pristionchus mayeri]